MNRYNYYIKTKETTFDEINKVIKNTYMLLSLTILFSALMSFISIKLNLKHINIFAYILISFSLLFLIERFKDSWIGLVMVFLFTGFEGIYIGPIIKLFLKTQHGQELITISLLISGSIFFILSAYVHLTKKDFKFLHGFILTGIVLSICLILISFFIKTTLMQLLISGFIVIISSSLILYETSNLIHDREQNYISATISLYLQIYNLFLSILSILNIFSSKE